MSFMYRFPRHVWPIAHLERVQYYKATSTDIAVRIISDSRYFGNMGSNETSVTLHIRPFAGAVSLLYLKHPFFNLFVSLFFQEQIWNSLYIQELFSHNLSSIYSKYTGYNPGSRILITVYINSVKIGRPK